MYYGDEIGMHDVAIPADEIQDPFERNEPGKGLGRDPQRTPMRWDATEGAGFTQGRPWLRLGGDVATINVASESGDEASQLTLYRCLLALRRASEALTAGRFTLLQASDAVLVYERSTDNDTVRVALNLTDGNARFDQAPDQAAARLLVSTLAGEPPATHLRANEGRVWQVTKRTNSSSEG
jgi:alpha-glucosidase